MRGSVLQKSEVVEARKRKKRGAHAALCGALVLVCVTVFAISPAFADAASQYADQLGTLRAELVKLTEQDTAGLAQEDIARISGWLDEAEKELAERDAESASFLLKRSEYGLDLVRALTVASQIESKATEQEKAFSQVDEQIAALKTEAEALQAQKAQLTQQLNQLR